MKEYLKFYDPIYFSLVLKLFYWCSLRLAMCCMLVVIQRTGYLVWLHDITNKSSFLLW